MFTYFIFSILLFVITKQLNDKPFDVVGVSPYKFLNPLKPLFVKTSNIGVLVSLNVLIILLAATLPVLMGTFWIFVYKIKMNWSLKIFKKGK
nr:hypothetical protein [Mycoplasma leonicaptivi]